MPWNCGNVIDQIRIWLFLATGQKRLFIYVPKSAVVVNSAMLTIRNKLRSKLNFDPNLGCVKHATLYFSMSTAVFIKKLIATFL